MSVAAGVVLFLWGFVSHAVLAWYDPIYHRFTDEAAVYAALQDNASRRGLYYLPYADYDRGAGRVEAFVNVLPR